MVQQWKQLIDSVPGNNQKKSCNYTAKGGKNACCSEVVGFLLVVVEQNFY